MKLRPDQQRVKTLISDTITLLCKNGLIYDSEFCVEAVIGITLDKNQVFLVNINETVTKARKQQINLNGPVSKQRKRRASEEHSKKNGHSHEEGVSAHKTSKISVKDVLNAQLKTLGSIHHVKSNEQSRSPIVSLPESEERGEAFDLSFKNNPSALHVIRPDPAEENSHDHLVIEPTSKDEAEKIDKVDESIPASLDGNFEPIGTGPPVWPGLEPTLPFSSSSIDAESMADVTQSSTNENLNQSQETRNKRKKSRPIKVENERSKITLSPSQLGGHSVHLSGAIPVPDESFRSHSEARDSATDIPTHVMTDFMQSKYPPLQPRGFTPSRGPYSPNSFSNMSPYSPAASRRGGVEDFTCNTCNKTFRSKEGWKIHMERHQGKSRYKCPHCSRGFMAQTHLKAHISEHTNQLPWACDICDMKFKYLFTLKKHRSEAHGK